MISLRELVVHVHADERVVKSWISAGWLIPRREPDVTFSEIDLARAQLIRELQEDLGVNDEGIEVILHLLDQLHGVRARMQALVDELRRNRKQQRETGE